MKTFRFELEDQYTLEELAAGCRALGMAYQPRRPVTARPPALEDVARELATARAELERLPDRTQEQIDTFLQIALEEPLDFSGLSDRAVQDRTAIVATHFLANAFKDRLRQFGFEFGDITVTPDGKIRVTGELNRILQRITIN